MVLVFLANGFEDVETITPIDFLRRANLNVQTVSINEGPFVESSHGISVKADCLFSDLAGSLLADPLASGVEAVLCPGGMPGSANLASHSGLCSALRLCNEANLLVAAICAAPALVLGKGGANILGSRKFTCYPGFESQAQSGIHCPDQRIVKDENLISAIAAGAAAEFSFAVIEALINREAAVEVYNSTVQPQGLTF